MPSKFENPLQRLEQKLKIGGFSVYFCLLRETAIAAIALMTTAAIPTNRTVFGACYGFGMGERDVAGAGVVLGVKVGVGVTMGAGVGALNCLF